MPGQTPLAFFSYSRRDSEFVLKLARDLRAGGAAIWLDQLDISPGQRWDTAVEAALAKCPHLLVVLSPASVESTNVLDEVSFALEEKKVVIPVLYCDCKIPFRLRRLQYVDTRVKYEKGVADLLHMLGAQKQAEIPRITAPSAPPRVEKAAPLLHEVAPPLEGIKVQPVVAQTQVAVPKSPPPKPGRETHPAKEGSSHFWKLAAALGIVLAIAGIWSALPKREYSQINESTRTGYVSSPGPNAPGPVISADWVRQFLELGEGPSSSRLRPYFDDVVSPYFSQSRAQWADIRADKEAYFQRFPTIQYMLVGQPKATAMGSGRQTLEFDMEYSTIRADGRSFAGASHVSLNLRLKDGQWKVTGITERKLNR